MAGSSTAASPARRTRASASPAKSSAKTAAASSAASTPQPTKTAEKSASKATHAAVAAENDDDEAPQELSLSAGRALVEEAQREVAVALEAARRRRRKTQTRRGREHAAGLGKSDAAQGNASDKPSKRAKRAAAQLSDAVLAQVAAMEDDGEEALDLSTQAVKRRGATVAFAGTRQTFNDDGDESDGGLAAEAENMMALLHSQDGEELLGDLMDDDDEDQAALSNAQAGITVKVLRDNQPLRRAPALSAQAFLAARTGAGVRRAAGASRSTRLQEAQRAASSPDKVDSRKERV